MAINVNDPGADAMTRKFAELAGIGITEAIERRRSAKTPRETTARLREKHGVALTPAARAPLPRDVFDDLWADH